MIPPDLDPLSFVAGCLVTVGLGCGLYVILLLFADSDCPQHTPDDRLYEPYD